MTTAVRSDFALMTLTAAHSDWTLGDWGPTNPKDPAICHVLLKVCKERALGLKLFFKKHCYIMHNIKSHIVHRYLSRFHMVS